MLQEVFRLPSVRFLTNNVACFIPSEKVILVTLFLLNVPTSVNSLVPKKQHEKKEFRHDCTDFSVGRKIVKRLSVFEP